MIVETIITTENGDGTIHVAPMGVRQENGYYVISPFRPSETLNNLERTGEAVMNLTDDVRIFAGCVTGRQEKWPTQPAKKIQGGILEAALAHTELRVDHVQGDDERPRFYCTGLASFNHRPFPGFNRAQAAVLEWFPGKPFSLDNYRSLQMDSLCNKENHEPTTIESIVPLYLGRNDSRNHYYNYRKKARR